MFAPIGAPGMGERASQNFRSASGFRDLLVHAVKVLVLSAYQRRPCTSMLRPREQKRIKMRLKWMCLMKFCFMQNNYWDTQRRFTGGMHNVPELATFDAWLQHWRVVHWRLNIISEILIDFQALVRMMKNLAGQCHFDFYPVCTHCVQLVNNWYIAEFKPHLEEETEWWKDLVKPRMGNPVHEIEPNRKSQYVESRRIPPPLNGDEFANFLHVCQCAKLAFDVERAATEENFEDALDTLEEDFYDIDSTIPKRDLLAADARVVKRAFTLRRKRRPNRTSVYSMKGQPPVTFSASDLVSCLGQVLSTLPTVKMDREAIEDQQDHLEDKQGGEILTTPQFIEVLRKKKREVREKEFDDSTQGKLLPAEDFTLSKHDVFLANSVLDGLRKSKLIQRFAGKCATSTKITVDLTNKEEVVRYGPKELASEGFRQTFNVLNRPEYNALNKLAEAGWKEAKSVVLNLHIRSYLPQQMNAYAFCVIMWGHSSDAQEAALSGSYVYLGDGEATMLQLPLLCEYVGHNLQDFEAYKRSLVLSTVFPEFSGIADGKAMFGITSIEFTEYLPTSHAGITHERDSWDAMLRNHTEEKRRFLAGFNVVDTIEKGNRKGFSFPDFDLKAVPRHQAVVRTFEDQDVAPILSKAKSMRVKTFGSFRAGNIPVNFLGTPSNGQVASKHSVSENAGYSVGDMKSAENFVFTQLITVPAASTKGNVLAGVDILANARTTMSGFYMRWLQKGYIDTNLKLICHLPRAPFAGMSFFVLIDGTGYLAKDAPTSLNEEEILSYPLHLVTTSDVSSYEFVLDWHRYIGQVPFAEENAFLRPTLFLVACVSSTLALSAKVEFYLEAQSVGEELPRTLAPSPVLSYPFQNSFLEDLDLFLPPKRLTLGERETTIIPLSFAKSKKSGDAVLYSHAAARLAHFQGIGGVLHGVVYLVGSQLVASQSRISMWSKEQHIQHQAVNVHVDTDTGVAFDLPIKDAFYASSVYGDSGAVIQVTCLCSPMSPNAIKAPFDMIFKIRGFTPDAPMCRTINFTQRFGWFAVEPTTSTGAIKLKIWPVSNHLESEDMKVTGYTNAFLQMCQTSTMHFGSVIIHFSWTLFGGTTNAATAGGVVTIAEGFGPEEENFRGHCRNLSIYEGRATVPLELGTFAGPTPLKKLDFKYRNWIRFTTPKGRNISSIFCAIEVLPGFSFYGRTGSPRLSVVGTTVPPTADASTSNSQGGDEDIGDQYSAALGRGRGRGSRPGPSPIRG
ncbi:polyprotien 2 [Cycas necrotic stunt virus]|uniref:RNA2 polyprotein n=2 Tax=Cycas necrotic stunt virus TaxID=173976 RepID=POL2_CNSV|nr:polyprotien 2 [Cycas necrotic stunt virus]Q8QVU9.2 RecName: Full=RNA2 polyprotein; AltName: Full=P2; Contains: RecName: Full=Protein 2A; Short=P2A; Contains: RecName: Full=Movement protein; AltName: Full=2B-MP; Contains: RecName: Full=Coat protein; AltName: Full=2C-CP [Cycas necrotic stunt virus]BAB89370.2 polyprotein 2 [Cycas necrotic stunt virus]